MVEIVMPRLSDTMEEGTILRWLKHDGEHVRRGEELVEIETDKATMNYLSDQEGVLKTVAREGDTLPVGELIAWVGDPSSSAPDAGSRTETRPRPTARPWPAACPAAKAQHRARRAQKSSRPRRTSGAPTDA